MRIGTPWRDLPPAYGPWQTVHGLFRRWQRDGVWSAVLAGLQARADAAGPITWDVNVDSTICRAHQHAVGARCDGRAQKEPPDGHRGEPDDHGLGRSRGGWTTRFTWPASKSRGRYRCWSQPVSGGTARSSRPFWKPSRRRGSRSSSATTR
ncbi:transposase [Streptomyces sp. NBC_01207]|nr:transposase [Streptomyces sp. NBC_01207]